MLQNKCLFACTSVGVFQIFALFRNFSPINFWGKYQPLYWLDAALCPPAGLPALFVCCLVLDMLCMLGFIRACLLKKELSVWEQWEWTKTLKLWGWKPENMSWGTLKHHRVGCIYSAGSSHWDITSIWLNFNKQTYEISPVTLMFNLAFHPLWAGNMSHRTKTFKLELKKRDIFGNLTDKDQVL